MLNRKSIITVLLVAALVVVVYLATSNRSQHGDPAKWMKQHGVVVARHKDVNGFCVDCHTKKLNQTKENFCNDCHKKSKVKLIK